MTEYAPMPPRRHTLKKAYPIYAWKKIMDKIRSECGNAQICERHGKGDDKVIILPEAWQELQTMISYGRRSPMNVKEQKYAGFGHFLKDEHNNTIVVVNHFIEILTTNRNTVGAANLGPNGEYNPGLDFLEYHREEFLKYEKQFNTDAYGFTVDPFLSLCGSSEFVLEGHTHPDLGVFYSQTDRISGEARAAKTPVCIFVCDPIRKEMLGSIGKYFSPSEVIVFTHGTPSDEKPIKHERSIPPIDEIMSLTAQCLRTYHYTGSMRIRPKLGGSKHLRIKIIIPRDKNNK